MDRGYNTKPHTKGNTMADDDGNQVAVDWLLRLRELQAQGMSFDDALKVANAECEKS